MGIIQTYPTSSNPIGGVNNDKRTLPDQTVSWNEKQRDDWQHSCMDFFSTMWMAGNPSRVKMLNNYRLINGYFDFSGSRPEVKSFFTEDASSLDDIDINIEHYPICTLPLKSLWGEEADRPFVFVAKAEDSESQSEFFRLKTDMLHQYIMQEAQGKIAEQLKAQGIEVTQENVQKMTPPEIQEALSRNYSTAAEDAANGILNLLYKELLIAEKFQKGWKDYTINAREYFWVGNRDGKLILDCVNPVNIVYDIAYDCDYLDEAEWVARGEYMTPSQIIANYKGFLTDTDTIRISKAFREDGNSESGGTVNTGMNMVELNTEWGYVSATSGTDANYPLDPNTNVIYNNFNNGGYYGYNGTSYIGSMNHILVIHAEWRSKRKLCELSYIGKDGQPDKTIVDGEFKLSKELIDAGWKTDYFWIDEVWEGTKIGKDIYVKIEPKSNQYRSYYNIERVKLGYTGGLYNNRNAPPTSILDEMKQYQTLYNIIMSKLKDDLNSELGQLLLWDITQVPNKHGFDLNTWMKFIRKMKIAFVDPTANNGTPSNFNQFTSIDATLRASINERMQLLNYLEERCWAQAGFNAQRLGNVSASETATGTTAALQKSYSQTADLFRSHNNIKQRVLNNLIEEAKVVYHDGIERTYFLNDMSRAGIKIDGKDFMWADIAVYVSDNTKDIKNIDYLKSLAGSALQAGASLYEVAEMGTEDSVSVIREKLRKINEYQKQMQQQEMDIKNKDIESRQQLLEAEHQFIASENEKNRQKDIYIAEIKALGTASLNDPGAEDRILEETKIALEREKMDREHLLKHSEHLANTQLKQRELDIKDKDTKIKADTAKYVSDNQLKIAKENKQKADRKKK